MSDASQSASKLGRHVWEDKKALAVGMRLVVCCRKFGRSGDRRWGRSSDPGFCVDVDSIRSNRTEQDVVCHSIAST